MHNLSDPPKPPELQVGKPATATTHTATPRDASPVEAVVTFTVNGQLKSLSQYHMGASAPVSNADLYRIAGSPTSLSNGGTAITNDSNPATINEGDSLTATY